MGFGVLNTQDIEGSTQCNSSSTAGSEILACVLHDGGCKLDPTFISMLVERWRLGTQTFHLPCDECRITLKNMALQLGLRVDGAIVMEVDVSYGK